MHELSSQRPGFGRGAESGVKRQFVEGRPLDEMGERKEGLERNRPRLDQALQLGDEIAARVDPAVAHRSAQELQELPGHASGVLPIDSFQPNQRKDFRRVRNDRGERDRPGRSISAV